MYTQDNAMGLFSTQINTKQMVPLCRQLATSYDAGIPIVKTFDIVGRQMKSSRLKSILTDMQTDIVNGSTLEEAAQAQSKYFSPFFIQLLSTGERGGHLDVMLRDLADYFEDRMAMRRSFIRTMAYPTLQLTAAWFLGSFALMTIKSLDFKALSFNFNTLLAHYAEFQATAGVVALIVLGICIVLSRLGVLNWITGWVSMFIWPFAPVTRRFGLARFFRSMSLLLGGGMNVIRCIEGAAAVTVNPYLERDLLKAIEPVKNGMTLTQAFSNSQYMPSMAREMILVGEQSGNLEYQLRKASDWLQQEATHAVEIMTKVFNVLIILAVGLVVGYVVITFWSNYFGGMLDAIGA